MSKKSNVEYLHEVIQKSVSGDKRVTHEEQVIKGDKGLMIKFYHKEGDKVEKIVIMKKGDDYSVRTKKGDNMEDVTMSKDELVKMLSKNKDLKYAVDFLKTQKGGKKASKKASKKSSKKSSKKASKKGSLKGGKRKSKKGSKKGSKKH